MIREIRNTANFIRTHPLTRSHPVAAAARILRWQLQSRMQPEIVVPWIAGRCLAVSRGMTGATGNIYAGLHEFYDMAFTLHLLRPGDLFADVGANIGSYTILAAGVCGAQSIAFEPDPVTAAKLKHNVELNGLLPLVEIHVAAAGETKGAVAFTVGRDTENRVVDCGEGRMVPVETLDSALGERTPLLIKLDVEGYEQKVLKGACRLLQDARLRAVLTEDRSTEVVNLLHGAGFSEAAYDAFAHRIVPASQISMANALFIRDDSFVEQRVRSAAAIPVFGQPV